MNMTATHGISHPALRRLSEHDLERYWLFAAPAADVSLGRPISLAGHLRDLIHAYGAADVLKALEEITTTGKATE